MVLTPMQELFLISLAISFIYGLSYRLLTNPKEIRAIKAESKEFKEKISAARKAGNNDEANKLMAESMKVQQKLMRSNMKPMIASFGIFIIGVWYILGPLYGGVVELTLPFTLPLFSYAFPFIVLRESIGWFWFYILITVPFIFIFRKLLGAE